jgi:hypothetical protein
MVYPLIIAYSVFALLFIYQLWVTVMVCRADEYDNKQRILQCLAIWLIPFLAALTCHLVLRSSRAPVRTANTSFVDQSANGDMPQHNSATD